MSDRLPRRGFFSVLASLPVMIAGLFGRRVDQPTAVAELPAAAAEGPFMKQALGHMERHRKMLSDMHLEQMRMLREQDAFAEQHRSVLKLQEELLKHRAERDREPS